MLKFLSIVNFAVIPKLRIEFHAGLNLLTGETGAGKSIIVDALSLLLGARSSPMVIRTGERVALVEGTFELKGEPGHKVKELLSTAGVLLEVDEELIVRRELQAGGRTRTFVNDRNVTAGTLKAIQPFLIEIHGQGEQQELVVPRAQLRLLDAFGKCEALRASVSEAYARWRSLNDSLRAIISDEMERARTLDLLRYQFAELERVNPQPAEDEALAAEKALLAHAERVAELSAKAFAALYETDDSILTQLASVRRWLQDLRVFDTRVAPMLDSIEAAAITLTDAADGLRSYGAGLDSSPERLEEIEHRLAELERLKRKYGRGLTGLDEISVELRNRIGELENWAEREQELQSRLAETEQAYVAAAGRLTECRRKTAPLLAERVTAELPHIALEHAKFIVRVETARSRGVWPTSAGADDDGDKEVAFWTPNGSDRVEFLLAANVGEEARPLSRVASGGELSRLMLTLRTVAQRDSTQSDAGAQGATLIFDEIDVGIGGRVAEAVGRRLKTLAATQQVLCVTHQPQIARFADHHYVVEKQVADGRTASVVREVEAEARVSELARMIGGTEDVTTTRETARWLIESAKPPPQTGPAAVETGKQPRAKGRQRRPA